MLRFLLAVAVLGLAITPFALSEDGGPVVEKPTNCDISKTLGDSEDYKNGPSGSVVECITGGSNGNTIWLYGGRDWADGKAGSDPTYGMDAQDILFGGKGGDEIQGGDGDDTLRTGCPGGCDQTGQNVYDHLVGGPGDDDLGGANGMYTWFECGAGYDRVYFDAGLDKVDSSCEDRHGQ